LRRREGLNQAELWLDRYDIEPAENFTEKIEAALKQSRMIIPILSPNWVTRPWCLKELERFLELKSEEGNGVDCIVLVKKREPPESDVPVSLRNREGYKFFTKEPGGRIREFYWRGLKDKDAYFDVLGRIAEWISERMLTNARTVKSARPTSGRTIYVAEPADELRDAWQRLANDLAGAGYSVVPTEPRLPDNAAQADELIRAALNDRTQRGSRTAILRNKNLAAPTTFGACIIAATLSTATRRTRAVVARTHRA
jgi:TIR domain